MVVLEIEHSDSGERLHIDVLYRVHRSGGMFSGAAAAFACAVLLGVCGDALPARQPQWAAMGCAAAVPPAFLVVLWSTDHWVFGREGTLQRVGEWLGENHAVPWWELQLFRCYATHPLLPALVTSLSSVSSC
eukprot:gene3982-5661_t